MLANNDRYDIRYDFPDFSPRLEDYFNDFVDDPSRPEYSFSIDARYRLVSEHGYGVYWIICDALSYKHKGEVSNIPYYTDIYNAINYVGGLLKEGKIKIKMKEGNEEFSLGLYQYPKDADTFIKDAQILLNKKSNRGIENEGNNMRDPYSDLFNLKHHELLITLPNNPFWDELGTGENKTGTDGDLTQKPLVSKKSPTKIIRI